MALANAFSRMVRAQGSVWTKFARGMAAVPRGGRRVWEEREPPRPKEVGKDGVHLAHHTDLTGGKLPPNQEQNARLSDEAKDAMVQMHEDDPEKYACERERRA